MMAILECAKFVMIMNFNRACPISIPCVDNKQHCYPKLMENKNYQKYYVGLQFP